MKCWNSAFNAQITLESNYSNCTGGRREYICSSSGGAQVKGKTHGTQFTAGIGGKTNLGPSYFAL